jgi:hypothetical protein
VVQLTRHGRHYRDLIGFVLGQGRNHLGQSGIVSTHRKTLSFYQAFTRLRIGKKTILACLQSEGRERQNAAEYTNDG